MFAAHNALMTGAKLPASYRASARQSMPTHQTGDLLLWWGFNSGSQTIPNLPSGWTNITALNSSTNTSTSSVTTPGAWYGMRVAYRIAASNATTAPTEATDYSIASMSNATSIGANQTKGGANAGTTFTTPAVTLQQPNSSAFFVWMTGWFDGTSTLSPSTPAGYTSLGSYNSGGFGGTLLMQNSPLSGGSVTIGTTSSGNPTYIEISVVEVV